MLSSPGAPMLAFNIKADDPQRSGDDNADDQDAEGQRERIVDVVGPGGDVQEEREMNAHERTMGRRDWRAVGFTC